MTEATRAALYAGEVRRLDPSAASRALADAAWALLVDALGDEPRAAHARMDNGVLLARLAEVRAALFERAIVERALAVIEGAGFRATDHALDVPRLRAVVPGAHRIEAAAPVFVAHRDTWYANPRAQINWWLPLHDVEPSHGFSIFPRCFSTAVENRSADFDYARWRTEVGWQRPHAPRGAPYPGATEAFDARDAVAVCGPRASVTLFAAAHLHQTHAFDGDAIRFSLDFRTVHLADHRAGLGAPSVDDRSGGSTLEDFAHRPPEARA